MTLRKLRSSDEETQNIINNKGRVAFLLSLEWVSTFNCGHDQLKDEWSLVRSPNFMDEENRVKLFVMVTVDRLNLFRQLQLAISIASFLRQDYLLHGLYSF